MGNCVCGIGKVREEELKYICKRRAREDNSTEPNAEIVKKHLIGLALSGGGIRSATTNLGILQALSKMGILPMVDYLSTVSGGGYIGSCLSSLLSQGKKENRIDGQNVCDQSRDDTTFTTEWKNFPFCADEDQAPAEALAQIKHLRTHGNFLIARLGLFSRETMRSIGNVLSGIAYHLFVVFLFLFAFSAFYMWTAKILAPGMAETLSQPAWQTTAETTTQIDTKIAGETRSSLEIRTKLAQPGFVDGLKQQGNVLASAVQNLAKDFWGDWGPARLLVGLGAIAACIAFLIVSYAVTGACSWHKKARIRKGESEEEAFECRLLCRMCFGISILALAAVALACWFSRSLEDSQMQTARLLFPFLFFLSARVVAFVVHLLSNWSTKLWTRQFRSMWGTFQAFTGYALLTTLIAGLFPFLVYALADYGFAATVGALISLISSRFLVYPLYSHGEKSKKLPTGLIKFALGLAVGLFLVLIVLAFCVFIAKWQLLPLIYSALGAILLFAALGIGVNLNRLSPHYFYRDRLIETYLRTEKDNGEGKMETIRDHMNMSLSELHGNNGSSCTAPYQLISAAINLTGSKDLTRKDRKSGCFLFSKLFCGSDQTGYLETEKYRSNETKLARAMTISGAAVSSAMGFHTFFGQSFAMSLFNIRLGYWLENPNRVKTMANTENRVFWPLYLLKEMFSKTNAEDRLINLSDGGHTGDNVGIYPLLKRRCKVIIACDAECDKNLSFGSFTEALRHAYIDEGIDVDIDLTMIRPDPSSGRSQKHCAVGRIRYPDDDRTDQKSWLIYLKSSLTGDEPEPVLNYKVDNPSFPHQTTADQFFDDAQFEAYRALGVHITEHTFGKWIKSPDFTKLQNAYSPFGTNNSKHTTGIYKENDTWTCLQIMHSTHDAADDIDFQNLDDKLMQLQKMFMSSPDLGKYYQECYLGGDTLQPLELHEQITQACMMQARLMEEVFFARKLYRHGNAPANHGWMNLFRQWGRCDTFCIQFGNITHLFSPKFVNFYYNHIECKPPILEMPIPHPWDGPGGAGIFLDSGRMEAAV